MKAALARPGLTLGLGFALLWGGTCGAPSAAASGPGLLLRPGVRSGGLRLHALRRGEGPLSLVVRYGVHPVRIGPGFAQGRRLAGTLRVDTRRVTPTFSPLVQGVVLNVPEAQVYLVEDGRLVKEYPVAVSHPSTPTWVGSTRVVSKRKNPTWFVPASIQKEMEEKGQRVLTSVPPGPRNPLGPRWIGIWNGNFGLHGTNNPASIKQYASHGCVRFRAADIRDLFDRVSLGTPVRIVYQPVTLAADREGLWLTAYPDVYERGFDYPGAVRELAAAAGAGARVDWAAVQGALRRRNGIMVNVAKGAGAEAEPAVPPAARPVPATRPPARPTALPTPNLGPTPFGGWPEVGPEGGSPEAVPPDLPELPGSAP